MNDKEISQMTFSELIELIKSLLDDVELRLMQVI